MVVLIKGVRYKVQLLAKKKYIQKHEDKSVAHLDKTDKLLVFRQDHIKKNIVVHEVVHAYLHSLHLSSCHDISIEDFEEIVCEMMEEHLLDINRTSNEIFRWLKENKDGK